jgi:hypothetical protein
MKRQFCTSSRRRDAAPSHQRITNLAQRTSRLGSTLTSAWMLSATSPRRARDDGCLAELQRFNHRREARRGRKRLLLDANQDDLPCHRRLDTNRSENDPPLLALVLFGHNIVGAR